MARITPSRGFAAELATSFVIMIAAQLGLPTSSSQCITGGFVCMCVYVCVCFYNVVQLGLPTSSS